MSGTIEPALAVVPASDSRRGVRAMTLVGAAASAAVGELPADVPVERVVWPDASDPRPPAAALRDILSAPDTCPGHLYVVSGLERVSPVEIPKVLRTLRAFGPPAMRVCVDCAPAGQFNHGYQTIRPSSTWRTLFELAGFEIDGETPVVAPTPSGDLWSARDHWARFNPFREEDPTALRVFALRHAASPPDATAATNRVLGNRPRAALPPAFEGLRGHLAFLVGTYQEFRQFLPLWAALDPARFTVLLRVAPSDHIGPLRHQAIEAWCATRDIRVVHVSRTSDVDWGRGAGDGRVLVAGADSTAFPSHILNAAFITTARTHGWATVQLQHGVWPYASVPAPIAMASELVLTWSSEFEQSLRTEVDWADGTRGPRAIIDDTRFATAGCPLFDRYADATAPSLADLLGAWVSRYRHAVLVATNLHWSEHRHGDDANDAVLDAAAVMPDTLFIVKPHPVHDLGEAFLARCPRNVLVLDEFCCLFAGLDSALLVRATDALVATLSTVALEAALAGRPFVIIDTGNRNTYEHVPTVAPRDLVGHLATLLHVPRDRSAFRDHYFDIARLGGGTSHVLTHLAQEMSRYVPETLSRASLLARTLAEAAVAGFAAPAIASAATDPQLPTGDERAALAGTVGRPSVKNPYVTDADPRLNGRERLTADRTYYVRNDGHDSNDGLTSTGALRTIQRAVSLVAGSIDMGGYQCTIEVAAGTYTESVILGKYVGERPPIVRGDIVTPSAVEVACTGASPCFVNHLTGAHWAIEGFKVTHSAANAVVARGAVLSLKNIEFGAAAGFHMYADLCGHIVIAGDYAISGGAIAHAAADSPGSTVRLNGRHVTLVNAPVFSIAFAHAQRCALVQASQATFGGSASGRRFWAAMNGVIDTGGGGEGYFPGQESGRTVSGGQYF